MRKLILMLLMVCIGAYYSLIYSQDSFNQSVLTDNVQTNSANNNAENCPLISIGINPAGFLQFGPSVHFDLKLFNRTCLSAFYINHSMGMLSEDMVFGDDPRLYGSNCMGFGAGFKQYFGNKEKKNMWYVGILSGYSYNEATYNDGPPKECIERVNSLVFAANFGRRWNIGNWFYLSAGIFGGTSYAYNDKLYSTHIYEYETLNFVKKERIIDDYSGEIYPYAFVEITLGINL